jgi:hypothetical protein
MKQVKFFIGTDVSKEWLDMCIMLHENVLHNSRIANKPSAIRNWIRQTQKQYGYTAQDTLFACEFTGIYTGHLLGVLHTMGAAVWLIPGILISTRFSVNSQLKCQSSNKAGQKNQINLCS